MVANKVAYISNSLRAISVFPPLIYLFTFPPGCSLPLLLPVYSTHAPSPSLRSGEVRTISCFSVFDMISKTGTYDSIPQVRGENVIPEPFLEQKKPTNSWGFSLSPKPTEKVQTPLSRVKINYNLSVSSFPDSSQPSLASFIIKTPVGVFFL